MPEWCTIRLPATPVERMECLPGEEAQVDFGLGAPVDVDGHRRWSWVFRIVLSHSRKGYSEAVFRQSTEEFICKRQPEHPLPAPVTA